MWHDYLIEAHAREYTLNDHQQRFLRLIDELGTNKEWIEARDAASRIPDTPSPPPPPADAPEPEFDLREKVEVVLNDRNRTPRKGWVRDRVWHFKRREWMFFLETRKDESVSKRYFVEDLRSIDNRTKPSSEQDVGRNAGHTPG